MRLCGCGSDYAHAADDLRDLNKFFTTEKGSSAAMRELTENFLRTATGRAFAARGRREDRRAEAETDKDVPPGRFTHLIDAANAWCRDPANAKYRGSKIMIPHSTCFWRRNTGA